MDRDYLTLKRASPSRPSGEWSDDDYDVLADGEVVGRIFKANAVPVGSAWMWTLAFWHHVARRPTATPRTARRRWRHSPRAGGGSSGQLARLAGSPWGRRSSRHTLRKDAIVSQFKHRAGRNCDNPR